MIVARDLEVPERMERIVEVIADREIHGELLTIDDKQFIRCRLVDCILEYSGRPVVFDRTHMQRCRYVFFGEARSTVHFLQGVGLMDYTPREWGEFAPSGQLAGPVN